MREITIKKLTRNDWKIYKKLRIQMLSEEPQAYSQNLEEVSNRSDEEWIKKTKGSDVAVIVAFVDKKPVGMNGLYYEENHIVTIWGMFVIKPYRGLGVGKRLMERVEEEIRKDKKVKKIQISVTSSQISAWDLYKKLGFIEVDRIPNKINVNKQLFDEIHLEKVTNN